MASSAIPAGNSSLHDDLVEKMYDRQLATYRGILGRGVADGVFELGPPLETSAMTLVAPEDSYGLHIVVGNSRITVAVGEAAMGAVAEQVGAPIARPQRDQSAGGQSGVPR